MENDAEHNPCPSLLAKLIKMAIKFGIMKTKSVQSRSRSPAGKKPQTEHPAHGIPVPAPAPFGCPSAAAAATVAQEAHPRPSSTGAITLPCSCCPSPVPWPAATIPTGSGMQALGAWPSVFPSLPVSADLAHHFSPLAVEQACFICK